MIQCINFPDMLVRVGEFINHCNLNQLVTQHLAAVLFRVAGFQSVVFLYFDIHHPIFVIDDDLTSLVVAMISGSLTGRSPIAFNVCVISSNF